MNEAIQTAITDIERDHGVRVLYAAESGSRAWGFASPDSDYDVRFVYAHPRNWYLHVFEQRDVIEKMLPGDLDVSGWDLRKSLRLLSKCNLAFNEWFDSPIVYRADEAFARDVRAAITQCFEPARALYHYLGIARSTYGDYLAGDDVRLKKVFYFLRPILACRWVEHALTQPPTQFGKLLEAEWVSDEERGWIAALEARKAQASEGETVPLEKSLRQWMLQQAEYFQQISPALAKPRPATDHALLDPLLLRWTR